MKGTFALKRDDGYIEIIDELTGRVVAVQEDPSFNHVKMEEKFFKIQAPDGLDCWIQKGMSPDKVLSPVPKYEFSKIIGDIICQRIVEGELLTKICADPNVPGYSIISRWRRENEDFHKAIRIATEERAEFYHDKALDTADGSNDKDTVANDKLKVDTLKWAAGVGSPDKYGTKTKVVGDANAPLAIIIDTGIRRDGDPGYNKDECFDVTPETKLNGHTESTAEDNNTTADDNISGDTAESIID